MTEAEEAVFEQKYAGAPLTVEHLDGIADIIVDTVKDALVSRDQRIAELEERLSAAVRRIADLEDTTVRTTPPTPSERRASAAH